MLYTMSLVATFDRADSCAVRRSTPSFIFIFNCVRVAQAMLAQNRATMWDGSGDRLAEALELKNEGNACFKREEAALAIAAYTRAIALLGRWYHLTEQALAAEGMFRGALDQYALAFATHNPLHRAQHAVTLRWYGELLSEWDKREPEGADLVAQADALESDTASGALPASVRTLRGLFLLPP